MDNRINKNRLSNFLSYEWILMLGAVAIAIILWELMYTVFAVRLTVGQQFSYYFDENLGGSNSAAFEKLLEDKGTFSYDILSVSDEHLSGKYNVLNLRLSVKEGDILITETSTEEKEGVAVSKGKGYLDTYIFYDMDSLFRDGLSYLQGFLKAGETDALNYANLDGEKIKAAFLERMKGDNRFRTDSQKADGIILEKGRIKKLCEDLADFKTVLEYDDQLIAEGQPSLFFRYTKYEQALATAKSVEDKNRYQELYQKEIDEGRANLRYGLKTAMLTGGNTDPTAYFCGAADTQVKPEDIIITVFNFRDAQPELQYETVSFIDTVVRECSDFLG